jgi:signal peptidase II
MLSFGSSLSAELRFYIFTVLVGLGLFAALLYIVIKPVSKYNLSLGVLILGGGFGNLYDRAFNNGLVVDFMLIDVGIARTGVFNVADMAIMAGALGMLVFSFGKEKLAP